MLHPLHLRFLFFLPEALFVGLKGLDTDAGEPGCVLGAEEFDPSKDVSSVESVPFIEGGARLAEAGEEGSVDEVGAGDTGAAAGAMTLAVVGA